MTAKQKLEKLNKLLGHAIVHVKVGGDLKDFGIHKSLICHYSPYFKAAFNSGFQESITGIMTLPETKPEVFELFYHWLYTQDLDLPPWKPTALTAEAKCKNIDCCHCNPHRVGNISKVGDISDDSDDSDDSDEISQIGQIVDSSDSSDSSDSDEIGQIGAIDDSDNSDSDYSDACYDDCPAIALYKRQVETIVMLYVFADIAQIPTLQNNCMKKLYETTRRASYVPIKELAYIWEHTLETSLLRKAMIDMLTWEWNTRGFLSELDIIPNVVKDELLISMSRCIKRIVPLRNDLSPLKSLSNYYVKVGEEST